MYNSNNASIYFYRQIVCACFKNRCFAMIVYCTKTREEKPKRNKKNNGMSGHRLVETGDVCTKTNSQSHNQKHVLFVNRESTWFSNRRENMADRWFGQIPIWWTKKISHPFESRWQLIVTSRVDDSFLSNFAVTNKFQFKITLNYSIEALCRLNKHSVTWKFLRFPKVFHNFSANENFSLTHCIANQFCTCRKWGVNIFSRMIF